MRQEVNEFDLEKVVGGIKISRYNSSSGVVHYNGKDYPFSDYNKLVSVTQGCVNSGSYSDEDLFNAYKAAGVI